MCRFETTLIVKNTFICAVGAEAMSPPSQNRRRSKTDGIELLSLFASDTVVPAASQSGLGSGETDSYDMLSEPPCWSADMEPNEELEGGLPKHPIADLSAALEGGGSRASWALSEISGSVLALAFDAQGSSLVLQALECAGPQFARELASKLRGSILDACSSPHAAAVLERLLQTLGAEWSACVAEAMLGHAHHLASHVFGSSLMRQLLESAPGIATTATLVDELLSAGVAVLVCHKFGHLVATSILSRGLPQHRTKVATALLTDLQRFSRHRFASLVVASALANCSKAEAHHLAGVVMGQAGAVASLACHAFGLRVVKAMLELPSDSQQALYYLQKSSRRLQKDKFGAQLLKELGMQGQCEEIGAGRIGGA